MLFQHWCWRKREERRRLLYHSTGERRKGKGEEGERKSRFVYTLALEREKGRGKKEKEKKGAYVVLILVDLRTKKREKSPAYQKRGREGEKRCNRKLLFVKLFSQIPWEEKREKEGKIRGASAWGPGEREEKERGGSILYVQQKP